MQRFNPRIISRTNVYIQRFFSSEKMVPNSWDPLMYEEAVKKYNNIKGKLDSKTRSKLDGILNQLQAHYDDNSDGNAKAAMSKNKDHSKTAKVEEAQKQFATMVMELDAK
uniref:Uncharacterized protein n=1 Tax=Panagrolaimus superbus TaxID=310955 RepID=A0A914XWG7_9BILA